MVIMRVRVFVTRVSLLYCINCLYCIVSTVFTVLYQLSLSKIYGLD